MDRCRQLADTVLESLPKRPRCGPWSSKVYRVIGLTVFAYSLFFSSHFLFPCNYAWSRIVTSTVHIITGSIVYIPTLPKKTIVFGNLTLAINNPLFSTEPHVYHVLGGELAACLAPFTKDWDISPEHRSWF